MIKSGGAKYAHAAHADTLFQLPREKSRKRDVCQFSNINFLQLIFYHSFTLNQNTNYTTNIYLFEIQMV